MALGCYVPKRRLYARSLLIRSNIRVSSGSVLLLSSFLVLPLTPTRCRLFVAPYHAQSHTHTRIGPSQKRTSVNTQHSEGTDIHFYGGIRTLSPSKRAAEDPRLTPRGHLHRQSVLRLV